MLGIVLLTTGSPRRNAKGWGVGRGGGGKVAVLSCIRHCNTAHDKKLKIRLCREETNTILVKKIRSFYGPDFSLSLTRKDFHRILQRIFSARALVLSANRILNSSLVNFKKTYVGKCRQIKTEKSCRRRGDIQPLRRRVPSPQIHCPLFGNAFHVLLNRVLHCLGNDKNEEGETEMNRTR